MKKLLYTLVLVLVSAAITYYVTSSVLSGEIEHKAQFEKGLKDLQLQFITNNSLLRPILDMEQRPDLQKYLNEANLLANWYFKNPVEKFWKSYPEKHDKQRLINEFRRLAKEQGRRQKAAKANLPIREESYELTSKVYDALKGGTYKAVASDFQGSVRFDIVDVKKKDNKLFWNFVTWGGIGDLVFGGWYIRWFKAPSEKDVAEYEKEVKKAKRHGREPELPDPNTLHFAQAASSSKSPVLPIFEGSDYIDDFPKGAKINYFVTPSCPPDAEEIEIKFKLKARAMAGDDQEMEFVFRLPVQSEWKGSWDGVKTVEATSDY